MEFADRSAEMKMESRRRIILLGACIGIAVVIWPSYTRSHSTGVAVVLVCLQGAVAFWMIYRNRWYGRITAALLTLFGISRLFGAALNPDGDSMLHAQVGAAIASSLLLMRFLSTHKNDAE